MRACFEAGAVATGCEYEIVEAAPAYAELTPDRWLAEVFRAEMVRLGRTPVPAEVEAALPLGSTDMGNVTQLMPGIHPVVGIDAGGASSTSPASPRRPPAPAPTKRSSRAQSCWRARSLRWPRHPPSGIGCSSCTRDGGSRA